MPNRLIKESICSSDTINELKWFEEVFFYRLLTVCDDYGRMDARPQILKGRMFPLKEDLRSGEIAKAMTALESAGLIHQYQVNGKPFLQVLTWNKHQQIRAKVPRYPGPEEADTICNQMISDDIMCARNPIQSESNPNPNPEETRACEDPSQRSECGSRSSPDTRRAMFDKFWAVYPKKVGKGAAEKAFERCRVSDDLLNTMLEAVKKAEKSAQWQEENGRFIPNPATWLNQRRWEDELRGPSPRPGRVTAQAYSSQREYDEKELEELLGVGKLFKAKGA